MDRKTLFAMVLLFASLLYWQKNYYPHSPSSVAAPIVATSQQAAASSQASPSKDASLSQASASSVNKAPVIADLRNSVAEIGRQGSYFSDWRLKDYRQGKDKESPPVDLPTVLGESDALQFSFDSEEYLYLNQTGGQLNQQGSKTRWFYEDKKIRMSREFEWDSGQSYVDVQTEYEFKEGTIPRFAFVSLVSAVYAKESRDEYFDRVGYFTENSYHSNQLHKAVELTSIATPIKWIDSTTRYFTVAVLDRSGFSPQGLIQPVGTQGARVSLVYPVQGKSGRISFRVFFGAKDLSVLRSIDKTLDHLVDFGWFPIVAHPLLSLLKWFYAYFKNYAIAIVLLTLIVKILTFPLNYKSMKSMKRMAHLNPQLQKLRERFKDDPQRLNQEMLSFMRTQGYNPWAGCLPIFIQMPVFIALYNVLQSCVELYQAPMGLWIQDLSVKDPFYILPALVTLTWWLQQRLTPQTVTDPTQKRIFQMMPVIFGVITVTLPAGLAIYFLANALLSILQQLVLNKKLDSQNVTVVAAKAQ